MKILMTASALTVLAAAAQAGSLETPVAEPAPVAMTQAPALGHDWTGAYGGLSFGNQSAESGSADDSELGYGAFAGYDYDFGQFVAGAELDFQSSDLNVGGLAIDNMTALKLRGGLDLGRTLVYATLGAERANTSLGDANGALAGIGLEYALTDNFSVGGEYLLHRFKDIGSSSTDADIDTVSLRGAFRF